MNILLTGATGFIGSHVAEALVQKGHDVHALIRPGSNTWRIRDILPKFHVILGDLLNPPSDLKAECCIHLAWDVQPGQYTSAPQNIDYLCGSLRLAKILATNGCRRFVAAGTCFEYATITDIPLCEAAQTCPQSLYAASKLSLCSVLEQFFAMKQIEFVWTRLFYQYGPQEDPRRLVPSIIRAVQEGRHAKLTLGEQVRDFLHVSDTANAVALLTESDMTGVVNIGSSQPVSVRTIAETIGKLLNRPELIVLGTSPYPTGEPMYIVADNSRLRLTGWEASYNLVTGLRDTVEWWATHRS